MIVVGSDRVNKKKLVCWEMFGVISGRLSSGASHWVPVYPWKSGMLAPWYRLSRVQCTILEQGVISALIYTLQHCETVLVSAATIPKLTTAKNTPLSYFDAGLSDEIYDFDLCSLMLSGLFRGRSFATMNGCTADTAVNSLTVFNILYTRLLSSLRTMKCLQPISVNSYFSC